MDSKSNLDTVRAALQNKAKGVEFILSGTEITKYANSANKQITRLSAIITEIQGPIPKLKICVAGKTNTSKSTIACKIIGANVFKSSEMAETKGFWTVESADHCSCKVSNDGFENEHKFLDLKSLEKFIKEMDRPEGSLLIKVPCVLDEQISIADTMGTSESAYVDEVARYCNDNANCLIYVISLASGGVMAEDQQLFERLLYHAKKQTVFVLSQEDILRDRCEDEDGYVDEAQVDACIRKFRNAVHLLCPNAEVLTAGNLHKPRIKDPRTDANLKELRDLIANKFGKNARCIQLDRQQSQLNHALDQLVIAVADASKALRSETAAKEDRRHRERESQIEELKVQSLIFIAECGKVLDQYIETKMRGDLLDIALGIPVEESWFNRSHFVENFAHKISPHVSKLLQDHLLQIMKNKLPDLTQSFATKTGVDLTDPSGRTGNAIGEMAGGFGLFFGVLGGTLEIVAGGTIATAAAVAAPVVAVASLLGAIMGTVFLGIKSAVKFVPAWGYNAAKEAVVDYLCQQVTKKRYVIQRNINAELNLHITSTCHKLKEENTAQKARVISQENADNVLIRQLHAVQLDA
eukprot:TRINITY_DN5688_c0_g2_i1.p1 TRINITY_DN5688_c0_g2~~TRINITY_DN5688_c0_g2_i1.p1  ORF type:complete len:581 (-),score=92.15 TRINITY_DN5688_c0_g2_i1:620-2362(-)